MRVYGLKFCKEVGRFAIPSGSFTLELQWDPSNGRKAAHVLSCASYSSLILSATFGGRCYLPLPNEAVGPSDLVTSDRGRIGIQACLMKEPSTLYFLN